MIRLLFLFAGFLALVGAGIGSDAAPIHYRTASASEVRPSDDCAQFFHDVCNNWRIGEWLPTLLDGFDPWRQHKASVVHFDDGFIYEGQVPKGKGWANSQGYPADGTRFVYGTAGPPKGTVVYDYAEAIAFYSQGCCAWRSTVLAAGVTSPPLPVVNRTLRSVHTVHGIALGDTVGRVEAVYGKESQRPIPQQLGMTLLSYTHQIDKSCGQFQNFAFLDGRLIYIELLSGC